MTEKDYTMLANWIKVNREVSNNTVKFVLNDMIDQLCQLIERDNPLFDRKRFIRACCPELKG